MRGWTGRLFRTGAVLSALALAGGIGAQTPIENDDCQSAIPITDGTYEGTTDGASVVDGAAGCSGLCECDGQSGTAPDVWFLYTATCDGNLVADTCGSEPLDTWLSIHEPGCTGDELACNDDACGPEEAAYQSTVQSSVFEGEQYLIRVSGRGAEVGDFVLNVRCAPPNDDCPNASPITDGTHQGTTEGAISLVEDTVCSGQQCECYGPSGNGPDVWYLYTATCDGRLTIDTLRLRAVLGHLPVDPASRM